MKDSVLRHWSWAIVGISALIISFGFARLLNVSGSLSGFLAIVVCFVFVSILIFRVFHIPSSLKNILVLDIAYLSLILMPCIATVRHQVWNTAFFILIALLIALVIHLLFKGQLSVRTKRALVMALTIGLVCYNGFCIWQRAEERKSGESEVQASYVYTTGNVDSYNPNVSFDIEHGRLATRSDLEEYFNAYREPHKLDQEHDGQPSFWNVMQRYDDKFFSNHSLKIVPIEEDSSSIRYQVEEYQYQSNPYLSIFAIGNNSTNKLNLYYRKYSPPVLSKDKLVCLIILELPKFSSTDTSVSAEFVLNPINIPVTEEFIEQFDIKNKVKANEN